VADFSPLEFSMIRQVHRTVASWCALTLVLTHAQAATSGTKESNLKYPETRRVNHVDTYFGVKVPDPYRWLEADVRESPEVAKWVKKENAVARAYLDAIPQRAAIEKRLTELWNYERYSPPVQKGGKYFYLKNDGLQNQPLLYVANSYNGAGRVLVDPNTWSKDGTIAMSTFEPSEDGRVVAYARSEAGSDWQQIYVLDVKSGKTLEDHIKWCRFTEVEWTKDGSGFYYNRYPEPPEGELHQTAALNQMIYFHKLGTKQAEDKLVYRRPDHPDWNFWATRSNDGQYLVLSISRSTDPQNQVWVRDASAAPDAPFKELIGDFKNQFSFLGNAGTKLYFLTDLDAPTKRIVAMDVNQPGREHLTGIVPARKATLDNASIIGGEILGQYMVDVLSEVDVFNLEGKRVSKIKLPGKGTVAAITGDQSDMEAFFVYTSYNVPTAVFRYDVAADNTEEVRQPHVTFNPADFAVEQVFYKSKDGTRIPMILAYRKDLKTDRPQPTLLYGYGGFSISIVPAFRPEYIDWMEMGGVLAVANMRGGGEYGEAWHLAGKDLNKQNVFDDFIAAAEWLIREGRASREKLAIMGGSNGGLLIGAVEVQRPDLFGACIPMVGVMDMLRFQEFTAGQFWRDEFGNIAKEDEFKSLLAYSPYRNIKKGTHYPPTLIMTADTDDRVVPMHSFKFAAKMQWAVAGLSEAGYNAPILLRIEYRAGHGAGTPVKKQIESATDRWAFLVKELRMETAD
jgi:prolyl oligopeptidase